MVDVACKPILMGYAMSNLRRKRSPHELADLLLRHDPNASIEVIANVISEWRDFSDDQRFGDHASADLDSAASDDQAPSDI
jgi:hypothetical protein